jgi:hypothetical protein
VWSEKEVDADRKRRPSGLLFLLCQAAIKRLRCWLADGSSTYFRVRLRRPLLAPWYSFLLQFGITLAKLTLILVVDNIDKPLDLCEILF